VCGFAARVAHHGEVEMRIWYVLLAVPLVALLYPPLYAKETPELFGFPFFYWYQFAWVPLTAGLTYFVYRMTRSSS
jgi:hypothetical protein